MAAEMEAIEHPVELLQWSLGCVGIVLRQAVWNVCLGACCGAWFWITANEEGRGLRNARIITLSALLIALGFFLVPSFRQAMSIAVDTLDGSPWARRIPQRELNKQGPNQLLIDAEQQRDAKMLAYVAVHEERIKMAQEAADQAVAMDPQWTWVYYVLASRDMQWDREPTPQSVVWIEKLRQWDPQNAATYFLEADRLVRTEPLSPTRPSDNQKWIQIMARGYDSPKYDTYFAQGFDLEREIAGRLGSVNPLRFTVAVVAHPLPNLINIRRYETSILNHAQDPSDLAQQARRVSIFGERMMASDTDFEELIGRQIALDGYRKLQPLAAPEDQALIVARIAQLSRSMARLQPLSDGNMDALIVNAMIVQACFVLIVIAVLTMAVSAAFSFFRRVQASAKINLVFFAAAGALLVACIVAFIAYLPYSHVVAQAMNPQTSVRDGLPLLLNFLKFAIAPRQLLFGLPARVYVWPYVWMVVLTALSLLALWLVLRQFRGTGQPLS